MTDEELTEVICTALATVDEWEYPATKTSTVGIFYGPIANTPEQAVGVRVYGLADSRDSGVRGRRVQVRYRGPRGAPQGADRLAALGTPTLENLSRVGGISGVTHLSMAPMGADDNGRDERTDNYIITLDNHNLEA